MADEDGEKTEAPTPRRRTEAREQGNIARSPELAAACLLLGGMILLGWYGQGLVGALRNLMAQMLGEPSLCSGMDTLRRDMLSAVRAVSIAIAPLLLGAFLIAVLVNLLQVGLFFDVGRLTPNIQGLNPFKGIGKIFGQNGQGVRLLMSFGKLVLVALVAYSAIHGRIQTILGAQELSFFQTFALGAGVIYAIIVRVGALMLVLAILDYIYQRFHTEKMLKMTKQEVKEEMRRMEGDPKVKQRRRQIAVQRVLQRIKKDVPTADVVVTNPTHFAIALKYDSAAMHAPRVIAKGQDLIAQRIREVAAEHGVPILERPPLARALYKLCEVGQEIPEQFYSTVAEILAYVYELSGKMKSKRKEMART